MKNAKVKVDSPSIDVFQPGENLRRQDDVAGGEVGGLVVDVLHHPLQRLQVGTLDLEQGLSH